MLMRLVCLGEILLRLSAPDHELLLQSPRLAVRVGGAEANVAVALSKLGHSAAMASIVPDNMLGHAAVGELRRHGVDTDLVLTAPGRMGLYFLSSGAIHRPSEVLYDRAGSAFAQSAGDLDPDRLLTGADALHVSGITPALGPAPTIAVKRAMEAAAERSIEVSFDCNFRPRLWGTGSRDPASTLSRLAGLATTLFGGLRDLAMLLGQEFGKVNSDDAFRAASDAAFAAFPRLQRVAAIMRREMSVDHHDLTARMATRKGLVASRDYSVTPIVDRIGSGDAFAAGILHGLRRNLADGETLAFGLAAACLKHSIPGDFNLVSEADVRLLIDNAGFAVRR